MSFITGIWNFYKSFWNHIYWEIAFFMNYRLSSFWGRVKKPSAGLGCFNRWSAKVGK